ncbi:acyl-CoA dehydrogenase [Alkalicaulis satelles]|uniref:Acyl-CoA dehydrogenase n=1 Tax=Alkalicaulis satelles TaxID=2609175 RepID=A0A5M6ZAC5_9PROT|nr:acyl-CoA dehydrogenase family protein [Alkalicaulis satelles]KAA5801656.1 acyl-CoA dehydrogenase [Alkalicaulis satelles]
MSFVLNEEETMLRDGAQQFLEEQAPVTALRALRDSGDPVGFSRDLWAAMAEMGWCGILVGEDHGGVDMGCAAAGLVLEQIGRNLAASPFLSTAVLGASAFNLAGTDAQKAAWLPKIAAGETVIALALDERARHNPSHITTRAAKDGNGFRLTGAKRYAVNGAGADLLIVAARTEDERINLFLVSPEAAGVTRTSRRTLDSHVPADITFEDVKLDGDALLSGAEDSEAAYRHLLDIGRAAQAAEALGVGQKAFDLTLDYIREREQFGAPIGSFQGMQHRAAHLYGELELARSLVRRALTTLDTQPAQAPLWCAAAKAKATAVSRLAAAEGIQMYGGVGMTDEYDIGLYYKRAQAAGEFLGDDAFNAGEVARMSGY